MKKTAILTILFFLISSILAGCSEKSKESAKETGKLTVYTTVYPLKYFTERIAGDLVIVETIYPPGSDEHTFEPSQRDMMKLADADLFFSIGLGLEGFVEKAKNTLKNEDVQFIAVGDKLNKTELVEETEHHEDEEDNHEEEEHHHGDVDPHIWLDPVYANEMALAIKDALVSKLPKEEKTFVDNYKKLSKELNELHTTFQSTIGNAKHKDIIVSHAAFGYWEKRYDLHQISISGLTTSSEPTQKDLEEIVKIAEEKNIKFILFEQNVSSKLGKIIQKEIGAKSLALHNLAVLTENNIHNKETYFTLMNENIQSLAKALNESK
ncbi:metal ABC transporter solute-binding protein, Zn/Mn family [Bacillus sp. CGMCC 1.16607]|uniref:metal ABC transporter solute-binding protein, Zn/Mn family n=1 Tax=Bacillus sp. CGMCC 1.16607 TaxID=3351842 RepID=UPI003631E851